MAVTEGTVRSIFRSMGPNFVTPIAMEYRLLDNNLGVELSKGPSFVRGGPDVWGVTVLEIVDAYRYRNRTELGNLFQTREQAEQHLNTIKEHSALERQTVQ